MSISANSVIKLVCQIRIRKIGNGTFLLPITKSSVSSSSFYRINELGELIVKKLDSASATDGIAFEDLVAYVSDHVMGANRDVLITDITSYIQQLSNYGFTEVI